MTTHEQKDIPETGDEKQKTLPKRRSKHVTEARALAQRAKLNAQKQEHVPQNVESITSRKAKGKNTQQDLQAKRRASTTIARTMEDYLQDHEGGNHSAKTLEWHRVSLGLMRTYLEQERGIPWLARLMRLISVAGLPLCAKCQVIMARYGVNGPFRRMLVQHALFSIGSCVAKRLSAIRWIG